MAAEMNQQKVLGYPAIYKHAYRPVKTPISYKNGALRGTPAHFPPK